MYYEFSSKDCVLFLETDLVRIAGATWLGSFWGHLCVFDACLKDSRAAHPAGKETSFNTPLT